MNIRQSLFSGAWYPSNKSECENQIETFLNDKLVKKPKSKEILGGIAPHAGWFFSGSIACNVIASMKSDEPELFIISGMHLPSNSLPYITKEGFFETPFGSLKVNETLSNELIKEFDFIVETTSKFEPDNTIELQLPFIKYFFPNVEILPLGMPPNNQIFEIADFLAETIKLHKIKFKILGSTDLTHYGSNYGFFIKGNIDDALLWAKNDNDKKFIDAVISKDENLILKTALKNHNACCSGAIAFLVRFLKHFNIKNPELISYLTSYDKAPSNSFVSYAGITFS